MIKKNELTAYTTRRPTSCSGVYRIPLPSAERPLLQRPVHHFLRQSAAPRMCVLFRALPYMNSIPRRMQDKVRNKLTKRQYENEVSWHVPTSGCASLVGFEHMVQSRVCVCPCPMLWAPWGDPQCRQFLIYTPNRGYTGKGMYYMPSTHNTTKHHGTPQTQHRQRQTARPAAGRGRQTPNAGVWTLKQI